MVKRTAMAPQATEATAFWTLVIGLRRLWDLSRTPAPSLLSFGIPGHPLVSRWNSSGEMKVTSSPLGFRHQDPHSGRSHVLVMKSLAGAESHSSALFQGTFSQSLADLSIRGTFRGEGWTRGFWLTHAR
jgi:hypothetical protein